MFAIRLLGQQKHGTQQPVSVASKVWFARWKLVFSDETRLQNLQLTSPHEKNTSHRKSRKTLCRIVCNQTPTWNFNVHLFGAGWKSFMFGNITCHSPKHSISHKTKPQKSCFCTYNMHTCMPCGANKVHIEASSSPSRRRVPSSASPCITSWHRIERTSPGKSGSKNMLIAQRW